MLLLGVETATRVGSIAVVNEEGLIGECTLNVGLTHSERLLPAIDQLLKNVDIPFSRIDALAISLGPGSFTGLRIGVSTIKGLAWSGKKPVVGVSTLDALAFCCPVSDMMVCPMLDARKQEVFTALYRWDRFLGMKRLTPDQAIAPAVFLQDIKEKTVFLGDGSQVYRSVIETRLGSEAFFAPPHLSYPRATAIALLGLEEMKRENFLDVKTLSPIYVRPSEAELKEKT